MSLKDKLRDDLKSAMKARDEVKVSTLRLALSAAKNSEIERGRELTDEETTEVLAREVKRRREAIEGAEKAGRADVAEREKQELDILAEYLPKQLGEEEIEAIAKEVMAEVGAAGPKDRGRVMGALMPRIKGRADGSLASRVVEKLLIADC